MFLLHIIISNKKLEIEEIPMVLENGWIKIPDADMYKEIIKKYIRRSEEIKQYGFVKKQYDSFANDMLKNYLHCFLIGNNIIMRIINRLLNRKLLYCLMDEKRYLAFRNYIECEAHRELFLSGINNKIYE